MGCITAASLAAATVLWIPLRTYQYIWRSSSRSGDVQPSPLGELALLLLLVLAHYPAHHAELANGVKEGLQALQDTAGATDTEGGTGSSGNSSGRPSISFARLYDYFATGDGDLAGKRARNEPLQWWW